MEKLTQADIEKLKEIESKATPGPWCYDGQHQEITHPTAGEGEDYWLIISECRQAPDQPIDADRFGHSYDNNLALIAEVRNNLPSLLKAAEYFLCDKEVFESITGNDYETSLGLMAYGKKAKEFFRDLDCRYRDFGNNPRLEIVLKNAKAAGLLEGE